MASNGKGAERERKRILEEADEVALENWARGLGMESGSFDRFTKEMLVIGGGALPIVGTAEQVAERLARLYYLRLDGVLLIFLSYLEDTIRFGEEIVPLLKQIGVVK